MEPVVPAAGSPAPGPGELARLRQAARDFEAIFLQQLVAGLRRAAVPGGAAPASAAQRLYGDLMDAELARAVARSGGVGLADVLVRDLLARSSAKKSSSPDRPGPMERTGGPPAPGGDPR